MPARAAAAACEVERMITVLEEMPTALQRDGRCLCRRVYLADSAADALPTDAAPGSLALVRSGDGVQLRMLFSDGAWGTV